MRDTGILAGGRIRPRSPVNSSQSPRWLNRSITRLLAQSEIYLIEDEGEVDPTRHEVIEVRRVTENERVNRIAATVRPGYGWRGQILRPQEVVAYVLGDPA